MSSSPRFRFTSTRAFSLVEMLVSLAIFSLLIISFTYVVELMNDTWIRGRAQVNDFTKARAMLDLMEHDLQAGLYRDDLPAFPIVGGVSTLEFYTLRSGISTSTTPSTVRDVSLVQYGINSGSAGIGVASTLQRYDFAIAWSDVPLNTMVFGNLASFAVSPTARDTAPGVLALQALFIGSNGTISTTYAPPSGANPTHCIAIAIAVASDQSLLQLNSTQLSNLQKGFKNAVTGTRSVKADWESYLNGNSMNWKQYPQSLATDLKTFERYVLLPNNP
jgi:prepilin-type N-terminal cleavage/methylation domain-containing protein